MDGVETEGNEVLVCSGDVEVDGEVDEVSVTLDEGLTVGVVEELGDSVCEELDLGSTLRMGLHLV